MLFSRARCFIFSALLAVFAASCSGGSSTAPGNLPSAPVAGGASTTRHHQTQTAPHTYPLTAQGYSGTLTLLSDAGAPEVSTSPTMSAMSTATTTTCPTTLTINVANPRAFPVTVDFDSFIVTFSCNVSGLFGATIFQVTPVPAVLTPIKLGDGTANGKYVLIKTSDTSDDVQMPAKSVFHLIVAPESSTAQVSFPIVNNTPTNLTSNDTLDHGSNLLFTYNTASGGTIYSAACFNAKNNGVLVPALSGIPIVGSPKFYCVLTPTNGTTFSFNGTNTFAIQNPDPDRAVIEVDGTPQTVQCTTDTTPNCSLPQFQIGGNTGVGNFIESNLKDLTLCVPVTEGTDCNGVNGTPAASTTTVANGQDFEVMVADDPSYAPSQPGVASVPWTGLFTLSVSGPCQDNTATSDPTPGAVTPPPEPSPYVDATTNGTAPGPYAEFDVTPTGTGTCSITVKEDPTNTFTNPARSTTLNVTIGAATLCFSTADGSCSISNGVATLSIPASAPIGTTNAGVNIANSANWNGVTVSQITALQFDYTGPTNVGGDPRINVPVTGGTLFVGGNACFVTQPDNTTELVDALHNASCNITTPSNSAAGYSNWAALIAAEPNLQITGAPYVIIDEPGTWTISNVLFTANTGS